VLDQGLGEARITGVDVDLGPAAQAGQVDELVGGAQPLAGADDVDAGQAWGWLAEGAGVGQLAPEVEAADEAEQVPQRGPLG